MMRKWRELAPFYFRATAAAPLFFTLAPPRRAPPFSVHASGVVAVKVAQVPSTDFIDICNLVTILKMSSFPNNDLALTF